MYEAEEVLDVVFPAHHQAPEVVKPGEEPLYPPAAAIPPERSAVLTSASPPPVGCNHFDPVVLGELAVERVRIVGFVADEPGRRLLEEASSQHAFHQLAFGWRSAVDSDGERKTVVSGDSDDLRALTPAGGSDGEAPFFALANVASTNASSRFSWPRSRSTRASSRKARSSLPLRTHCWKRRWQVWCGGYRSGISRHCAPVPNTHSTPFNTARVSCHGRPRLSARRCGRKTGSTAAHCSSLSSQRPRICRLKNGQSVFRIADFCAFGYL